MRGPGLGILAGAIAASVLACSAMGGPQKSTSRPQTANQASPIPAGDTPRTSNRHDEVARLYGEIERQLQAKGMDLPDAPACAERNQCDAAVSQVDAMGVKPLVPGGEHQCKRSDADTCSDVCTLSDSICTNAEKICDIAKQLGTQDEFANEKCARGASACKASQQRCCSCM